MAGEAPPDVVEELYGAPLDEFTALRDARAKELRKGDRAAADAVKRLRKPSVPAWAVNQLARRERDDLDALLAAGEALRQAQLGGGDRDAIRAASRDERDAVEQLVNAAGRALADAGRGAGGSVLEEVRQTLHAAALDDQTRELLSRGALTEARQAAGLGGFGAAPATRPKASPKGAPKGAAKAKKSAGAGAKQQGSARGDGKAARAAEAERKKADEEAERAAEAERKKAAKERVKAARAALRDAERAAGQAERAVAAAERDLDRARRDADAARAEAARRREELDAAETV